MSDPEVLDPLVKINQMFDNHFKWQLLGERAWKTGLFGEPIAYQTYINGQFCKEGNVPKYLPDPVEETTRLIAEKLMFGCNALVWRSQPHALMAGTVEVFRWRVAFVSIDPPTLRQGLWSTE